MLAHPITLENVAWDRERALVDYAQPGDKIEWAGNLGHTRERHSRGHRAAFTGRGKQGSRMKTHSAEKPLSAEEQILVDNYVRERVGDIFGG